MLTSLPVSRPAAITGDRPTGPLHVGHLVGSLRSRVTLQESHHLTVLIADLQALTDHQDQPEVIKDHILEVMKDYLAVGLDPQKVTFVLQSAVPALAELFQLLLNLVPQAVLERNPTVKVELAQKGFKSGVPAGFVSYPVSQAADIIGLGSGLIPVGQDQLPMIELTQHLIDKLRHRQPGFSLPDALPHLTQTPRLPGVLGMDTKMSKSQGLVIGLDACHEHLRTMIQKMYTDPLHLRVSDPGSVEGNVVFAYLDAFDPNVERVQAFKDQYQKGGLGDMVLKKHLLSCMEEEIAPIRDRRQALNGRKEELKDLLKEGTMRAAMAAQERLEEVRHILGVRRLF